MTNWTLMLASLSMATLPVLLLFIVLQKQFIRSLVGFSSTQLPIQSFHRHIPGFP